MKPTSADKLDHLIRLALSEGYEDADSKLFGSPEVVSVTFDEEYYRKRQKIIRRERWRHTMEVVHRCLNKVAMFALVLMSVGFLMIIGVSSLRNAVWGAMMDWYDDYVSIHFVPPIKGPVDTGETGEESVTEGDNSNESESTSGEEMESDSVVTPPKIIEQVRKPTYFPEGVEEELVSENKIGVCYDYYIGDVWVYNYRQGLLNEDNKYFDNEGIIIKNIQINGNDGIAVEHTNKPGKSIIWNDGEYVYWMDTDYYTLEELKVIAESVK